jgi:hemerythrin-like domain-containing protein
MEDIKPIRRCTELVPLSSDHHNGLLLCWKIKTGISNGTSLDSISTYLTGFYDAHLRPHFESEEQLVFTLISDDNPLRMQAEADHKSLHQLRITIGANEDDTIDAINEFNRLLEQHIRFEERELFPVIEQLAAPALLKKAGENLKKDSKTIPVVWDDNFWTKN